MVTMELIARLSDYKGKLTKQIEEEWLNVVINRHEAMELEHLLTRTIEELKTIEDSADDGK